KRLEADEGDLRFVLRGPDGRFVRLTAGDAELLQLLAGRTSLASLITPCLGATARRRWPPGPPPPRAASAPTAGAASPRSSQTWASAACSRASRRPSSGRCGGWWRGCSGRGGGAVRGRA